MVMKANEQIGKSLRPKDGTAGIERPRALLEALPEDPTPLMALSSRHVISARTFDRATLVQLFRLAAQYESTPQLMHMPLNSKILISAFYEPSTRTRLSFESAWHRLGGDIMSITDPATTGMAKGESLADIAEMFNNYGDVIVLRNNEEQAIYAMVDALRIPIINAGNGIDEHPTQAMADLYTIFKWKPELLKPDLADTQRIIVGVIGVPGRMRTVRSLLLLLGRFSSMIKEVVLICDEAEPFSPGQAEELAALGLNIRLSEDLNKDLPNFDVIYINAIAWVGNTFESMGKNLRLSTSSPLKPGAIILHPLARGDELSTDLDATEHNWYFAQARGAVFIRMALLTCMVRRVSEVMDTPITSS